MKEGSKIRITQTRGSAGRCGRTKATLSALGLGRVGKTREFTANAAILGMAHKLSHLVSVREVK